MFDDPKASLINMIQKLREIQNDEDEASEEEPSEEAVPSPPAQPSPMPMSQRLVLKQKSMPPPGPLWKKAFSSKDEFGLWLCVVLVLALYIAFYFW